MFRYFIKNIEEIICIVIFIVMLILGFLNVIVRNMSNYSMASSQEIVVNGMVLLTIYGAAIAIKYNQIIFINIFGNGSDGFFIKIVNIFRLFISVITLLFATYFSFNLVIDQFNSGIRSSALEIPSWIYSFLVPIGFFLMVVRQIQHRNKDK